MTSETNRVNGRRSITINGADPQTDEAAAALAAITAYLAQEEKQLVQHSHEEWEWHTSALLLAQRMLPGRIPIRPTWGSIERLRRSGRGGGGIVGM